MTDNKPTVTYKLIQKNQYTYQIKNGKKIVEKIGTVTGGFYWGCQIFDTLDQAVQNFKDSIESFSEAMGKTVEIKVEKQF